ncbi:MAG: aldehyde dehydrogenase family protein [Rhodothermales bacterium]|nr:aldehyde dehydrogenase family protein [Rhodothermales bacterium]
MDKDLQSIQQARELVEASNKAFLRFKDADQVLVDKVVAAMAAAGERAAEKLALHAHKETGFGRVESKIQKNLFATRTLHERMSGMRTAGIIRRLENDTIWEIAVPMGVVAGLVPSTNPTSTAMYKAIIAAKARCGIVLSPHPRAVESTCAALREVAEAAYTAGAPKGLFGCMTIVSLPGTNELLENPGTGVILATGGTPMVRAAYSKGKPAYGVGSGNVPVYVDRSADPAKAAADVMYGVSFDWGTLCSTERSVVVDVPVKKKLIDALKQEGAFFLNDSQADQLRDVVVRNGKLNIDQVGQSPATIARMAGFSVPESCRGLVVEVTHVGRQEPLSMETLSPILTFYTRDGWEAGCETCIEILNFGGMGHTLALHCNNDRVIEAFALQKPAMRIVVNTVAALGSVGYTNKLFPAMTLGPGAVGGSITSDNISPLHLVNIKRLAFETFPVTGKTRGSREAVHESTGWIDEIENRLRARAGNPPYKRPKQRKPLSTPTAISAPAGRPASQQPVDSPQKLSEAEINAIIDRFKK